MRQRRGRSRGQFLFGRGYGAGGGSEMAALSFGLNFNDVGSGQVNTTVFSGSVSPTFTRASVAWTKLASGLWAQVATGVPRSAYLGANTISGATTGYGGYLSEGARTQLVTPTAAIRDMTGAAWVKTNVTAAKTATGIDGAASSATRLTAGAIGGSILQTLVAAASTRTYSVWLRRVSGTGTVTISQGATTLDVTASLNSSTYTRVELSASVLNAAFGITFGTSGDVIEADFNQFEAGSFASTPIDAAGAARNADVLTYPTTGWLNASSGTLYAEYNIFAVNVGLNNRIFSLDDGSASEAIVLDTQSGTNARLVVEDGGANKVALPVTNTISANETAKACAVYTANDFAISMNGGTIATDTSGTIPTPTQAQIGGAFSVAGDEINGYIRRVTYWPRRLSNETLVSITS
mgnify:CR=1 FL=1